MSKMIDKITKILSRCNKNGRVTVARDEISKMVGEIKNDVDCSKIV
jgi:uncharacterized Rmd1/YagE family protein